MRRDLTGFLLSPLFLLSLRKQICPTPPHPQARDAAHNKEGAQHSWGAPECCTTPPQTPHSRTLFTPLPTQHGVRAPLPLPYPQRRPDSIPRLLPHPEAPRPNHPPKQKFLPGGVTHTFFGGGKPPPAARPRLAALLAGLPHLQPSLLPISEPSHPALFPSPIVPDKPKPAVPPRAPPPSRRRAQPSPRSVCLSVRPPFAPSLPRSVRAPPAAPQPLLSRGRRGDWFPARCGSERRSFVCSRLSLTRRPPLPPGPKTARPAPSHRPPPHPPSGLPPPAVGAVLRSKPRRQRSADPPRLCTAAPSASGAAMVDGVLLGSRWGGWGFAGVGVSPEEGEGRRWAKRGERSRVGSAAPCSCWPRARAERGDRSRSNASLQTVGLQNWRRCSAGGEVRRMGAVAAWPCSTCSVEASLQKEEGNSPG